VTRDDIEKRLLVGRSHRFRCVDARVVPEFPGYVRTITIFKDNKVIIELNPYGMDEGGPSFSASFTSLDVALASLEAFLGKSPDDWNGTYPDPPDATSPEEGHQLLRTAISSKTLPLPGGPFALREDGYWNLL
jgi:hypothetical protein